MSALEHARCSQCGVEASGEKDVREKFETRNDGGKEVPQTSCKACSV